MNSRESYFRKYESGLYFAPIFKVLLSVLAKSIRLQKILINLQLVEIYNTKQAQNFSLKNSLLFSRNISIISFNINVFKLRVRLFQFNLLSN